MRLSIPHGWVDPGSTMPDGPRCKDVDRCIDCPTRRGDDRRYPLVARALELLEAGPVHRQIDRLEHLDRHGRALGVQNKCREAVLAPPTCIDERTPNMPAEPTTSESAQLVMVLPAGGQRSIRGEAMLSRQSCVDHPHILPGRTSSQTDSVRQLASLR